MSYKFEICVSSVQGCKAAEDSGADRVELCAALTEGGTTPSIGCIRRCRDVCRTAKLHVIIRPRGGDFLYTEDELSTMEEDISAALDAGVDGFVLGCLTPEGQVDMKTMRRLIGCCSGRSITFHRAFDVCADPENALEDIISLKGIDRILSSGCEADALQGAEMLKKLNDQAAGRITFLAGAGINARNIREIQRISGVSEFHFSGKGLVDSNMIFRHPRVFMGMPGMDEYAVQITDPGCVRSTINALRGQSGWR